MPALGYNYDKDRDKGLLYIFKNPELNVVRKAFKG